MKRLKQSFGIGIIELNENPRGLSIQFLFSKFRAKSRN